ncbi:MAG: glucosaminidase domain-containing protein [Proteobacteria bacterium]|nr:glucosaminidase domain-containing protein [Pseudomonadota bacterium]
MKFRFEHGALLAVAGLITGLFYSVVTNPIENQPSSPKATLRLAVSVAVPVPAYAPIPAEIFPHEIAAPTASKRALKAVTNTVRMAGIDTLIGFFSVESDDRQHRLQRLKTTVALSETFNQLGYDLDLVRSGEAAVPRLFLASLPSDIKNIREAGLRKSLFFQTLLPLVLQANEELLRDRQRLWKLHFQQSLGQKPGPADRLWLMVMSERYGVKKNLIETLLKRVDIIPPSLALAQAAEESGWGTSRFVREGNAMFGQWTFSKTGNLVPTERDEDKKHKIRAFPNLLDSVRSYALNLNTHAAYRGMRKVRSGLRLNGAPLDGLLLVDNLKNYSARGEKYVQGIRALIESNNLHRFDDARLRDGNSGPRSLI